jgi:hypothetical protein
MGGNPGKSKNRISAIKGMAACSAFSLGYFRFENIHMWLPGSLPLAGESRERERP